jgi:hypothetical protein
MERNGMDLMDYHIFLLLLPSFLLFIITVGRILSCTLSFFRLLPCFALTLSRSCYILLLYFRTGLGGLARKGISWLWKHRIAYVRFACLIRNSRWRWRWMGIRLGFPTFIIFGSNEGVCVDRDKQTNKHVEVLDEPYLLYL